MWSPTLPEVKLHSVPASLLQCVVVLVVNSDWSQILQTYMLLLKLHNFVFLTCIKTSRLEAIKVDCPTLGERRTQMLNEWQKKVTPTWSAVVQALVGIGMGRLVSELAQKHGSLNSVFFFSPMEMLVASLQHF